MNDIQTIHRKLSERRFIVSITQFVFLGSKYSFSVLFRFISKSCSVHTMNPTIKAEINNCKGHLKSPWKLVISAFMVGFIVCTEHDVEMKRNNTLDTLILEIQMVWLIQTIHFFQVELHKWYYSMDIMASLRSLFVGNSSFTLTLLTCPPWIKHFEDRSTSEYDLCVLGIYSGVLWKLHTSDFVQSK